MNQLMIFTDLSVDIPPKIQTREAVRAVIIHEGKLLLMYSERDRMYGTPGGGITINESKLDTLYRELLEEVGAFKVRLHGHLGTVEEIRISRSNYGKVMKIVSDYYQVDVLEFVRENLEEHEEEMGLKPQWVEIDKAILQNETVLAECQDTKLTFYHTQTSVLKYLKNRFGL